jgi:hypothetical protein
MLVSALVSKQKIFLRLLIGMILITITLGTASFSVAYAIGPSSFSLEPSFLGPYAAAPRGYFVYNSSPGSQIHDSIYITNSGLTRGTVNLYAVDAITGQESGTTIRPPNLPQVDVGAWIKLSQQQVTLGPGQSEEVPFTLSIPTHVRPGQHGGIIIAKDLHPQQVAKPVPGSHAAIGIGVQSYIGLGVLINLPGHTVESLKATGISYDNDNVHQRLLIDLENSGTQLLHPVGSLRVTDDQGRLLQNLAITMDTFLPQTEIHYPIYIQHKALALGKSYTATLHLIYGHHHVLNYATSFYVPLQKEGPITNLIQSMVAPPTGTIFSILNIWDYIIGIVVLFFILSTLFFWIQKIRKTIRRNLRQK